MPPTRERPSARPQVRRGAQARPLRPGAAPLGRRRRVDRRERPVRRAGGAREARERAQHALPAQRPSSPPVPPQGAPGGSGRPSTPREAAGPPGALPPPRLLEPAATEAADSTASWSTQARRRAPSSTPSRTSTTRSASTSASPSARPRECGCCRAFAVCGGRVSCETVTDLMFGGCVYMGGHTHRSIIADRLCPSPPPANYSHL